MGINSGTFIKRGNAGKVAIEMLKHRRLGQMVTSDNYAPIKSIDKKKRKVKNRIAKQSRKLNRG